MPGIHNIDLSVAQIENLDTLYVNGNPHNTKRVYQTGLTYDIQEGETIDFVYQQPWDHGSNAWHHWYVGPGSQSVGNFDYLDHLSSDSNVVVAANNVSVFNKYVAFGDQEIMNNLGGSKPARSGAPDSITSSAIVTLTLTRTGTGAAGFGVFDLTSSIVIPGPSPTFTPGGGGTHAGLSVTDKSIELNRPIYFIITVTSTICRGGMKMNITHPSAGVSTPNVTDVSDGAINTLVSGAPPTLDGADVPAQRAQRKSYLKSLLAKFKTQREKSDTRTTHNGKKSFLLTQLPGSTSAKPCRVVEKVDASEAENVDVTEDVYVAVEDGDTFNWKRNDLVHSLSNTSDVYTLVVGGTPQFSDGAAGESKQYSSLGVTYTLELGGGEEGGSGGGSGGGGASGDPFITPMIC